MRLIEQPTLVGSVGMVGGKVFLTYPLHAAFVGSVPVLRWYGQWFDASTGEALAERDLFGTTGDQRGPMLAREADTLFGWFFVDAMNRIPAGPATERVTRFRARHVGDATSSLELTRVALSLYREEPHNTIGSEGFYPAGAEDLLPSVLTWTGPWFVYHARAPRCDSPYQNARRLLSFDERGGQGYLVFYPDDSTCNPSERYRVGNATALAGDDGSAIVLYREGTAPAGGAVMLARVDPATHRPLGPPVRVGSDASGYYLDGGFQVSAVTVAGGGLLFFERAQACHYHYGPDCKDDGLEWFPSNYNDCSILRHAGQDGSRPRHAAWQLPCLRLSNSEVFYEVMRTNRRFLGKLPRGRAVAVWNERNRYGLLTYVQLVTRDTPWREGIYLAMVTEDGLRGSEVVRVTDDEATALPPRPERTETYGPFPADFDLDIATEGDRVFVAWQDRRRHAPGIYGRLFRCTDAPGPDAAAP
jgi:hypothetical protein